MANKKTNAFLITKITSTVLICSTTLQVNAQETQESMADNNINDKIHSACLKATDYKGCVEAQSGKTLNIDQSSENIQEVEGTGVIAVSYSTFGNQSDRNSYLIARIIEGSPADKAGLREGDIIKTIDGESVEARAKAKEKIDFNSIDELKLKIHRQYENGKAPMRFTISKSKYSTNVDLSIDSYSSYDEFIKALSTDKTYAMLQNGCEKPRRAFYLGEQSRANFYGCYTEAEKKILIAQLEEKRRKSGLSFANILKGLAAAGQGFSAGYGAATRASQNNQIQNQMNNMQYQQNRLQQQQVYQNNAIRQMQFQQNLRMQSYPSMTPPGYRPIMPY